MRSEGENVEIPYAGRGVERAGESPWGSLAGELPAVADPPGAELAVPAFAGYLARLCGRDGFHVGYRTDAGDLPKVEGELVIPVMAGAEGEHAEAQAQQDPGAGGTDLPAGG